MEQTVKACVNCSCGKHALSETITKDMKINEVIGTYPEVVPILMGYGLHCVGCHFSHVDTLESGAKVHGFDDDLIDLMVQDANAIVKENVKEKVDGGKKMCACSC